LAEPKVDQIDLRRQGHLGDRLGFPDSRRPQIMTDW
jgi:hypothetical protein